MRHIPIKATTIEKKREVYLNDYPIAGRQFFLIDTTDYDCSVYMPDVANQTEIGILKKVDANSLYVYATTTGTIKGSSSKWFMLEEGEEYFEVLGTSSSWYPKQLREIEQSSSDSSSSKSSSSASSSSSESSSSSSSSTSNSTAVNSTSSVTGSSASSVSSSSDSSSSSSSSTSSITIEESTESSQSSGGQSSSSSPAWNYPDSAFINTGTLADGTVESLYTGGQTYYQIAEVTGTPGFDVEFHWNNVYDPIMAAEPDLSCVIWYVKGRYEGSVLHTVKAKIYNQYTESWVDLTSETDDMPHSISDDDYHFTVQDNLISYLDPGNYPLKLRLYHTSEGTESHNLYLDQMYIYTVDVTSESSVTDSSVSFESFSSDGSEVSSDSSFI